MHAPVSQLTMVTPTWAGDRLAADLLRRSIERSSLAGVRHLLVVQTEDSDYFSGSPGHGLEVVTTAALLPPRLEAVRVRAAALQARCGRRLTRLLGSLQGRSGWPNWPGHTGWHVQQVSKLMAVLEAETEVVVSIDSDVIVTPAARTGDFLGETDRIRCYSVLAPAGEASSRVRHWNAQAARLFDRRIEALHGTTAAGAVLVETGFDTPFIFRRSVVRALCDWLQDRYQSPWWEVLLRQPARHWSEFATYRAFLRAVYRDRPVQWRRPADQRYLFDASDPDHLARQVAGYLADPAVHFITIHSQSSGRRLWSPEDYIPVLRDVLERPGA